MDKFQAISLSDNVNLNREIRIDRTTSRARKCLSTQIDEVSVSVRCRNTPRTAAALQSRVHVSTRTLHKESKNTERRRRDGESIYLLPTMKTESTVRARPYSSVLRFNAFVVVFRVGARPYSRSFELRRHRNGRSSVEHWILHFFFGPHQRVRRDGRCLLRSCRLLCFRFSEPNLRVH